MQLLVDDELHHLVAELRDGEVSPFRLRYDGEMIRARRVPRALELTPEVDVVLLPEKVILDGLPGVLSLPS